MVLPFVSFFEAELQNITPNTLQGKWQRKRFTHVQKVSKTLDRANGTKPRRRGRVDVVTLTELRTDSSNKPKRLHGQTPNTKPEPKYWMRAPPSRSWEKLLRISKFTLSDIIRNETNLIVQDGSHVPTTEKAAGAT